MSIDNITCRNSQKWSLSHKTQKPSQIAQPQSEPKQPTEKQQNQQTPPPPPAYSQHYASLYAPIMDPIPIPSLPQIRQKLWEQGIAHGEDSFQEGFGKYCLRSNWESTYYSVKYGRFETTLKLIAINMRPIELFSNFISKGAFGEIYKIQLKNNKEFAVKNINSKSKKNFSIDEALQQVFLAKLLSALGVGPKFSSILGYDAILYPNCLQYCMQFCVTKFTQQLLLAEAKDKNLLMHLKLLHSLNICHNDIKLDNIGWSPVSQKLILLDFNLSSVVPITPGFKTLTKFKGTYSHCSPEMKKCYHLGVTQHVDPYFNDLHCLQVTWREMGYLAAKMKEEGSGLGVFYKVQEIQEEEEKQAEKVTLNDNISINQTIMRFFLMKKAIFDQEMVKISQMVLRQKILIETFKYLIATQLLKKPPSTESHKNLSKIYQIIQQKQALEQNHAKNKKSKKQKTKNQEYQQQKMQPIGAMFLAYEINNQNKQQIVTNNEYRQILQITDNEQLFIELWNSKKQLLFSIVDVYAHPQDNFRDVRMKVLNMISKIISKGCQSSQELSSTLKYHQVILYYFEYFSPTKNYQCLSRILTYIVLMGDQYHQNLLEDRILALREQDGKLLEYIRQNVRFYLGKFMSMKKNNVYLIWKNISNLQRMLEQYEVSRDAGQKYPQNLHQLMKIAKQFLKIMVLLKQGRLFDDITPQMEQKLTESVNNLKHKSLKYFDKELIQIFQALVKHKCFKSYQKSSYSLNQIKVQDLYLQKTIFKTSIMYHYVQESASSISLLLQTDPFTRQFQTHFNLLTFNQNFQTRRQLLEVNRDYMKIINNGSFMMDQSCLIGLPYLYKIEELQEMCLEYWNNFGLGDVRDFHDLLLLESRVFIFLCFHFSPEQGYGGNITHTYRQQLLSILVPLTKIIQLTSTSPTDILTSQQYPPQQQKFRQKTQKIHKKIFHNINTLLSCISSNYETSLDILDAKIKSMDEIYDELVNLQVYYAIYRDCREKARGSEDGVGERVEKDIMGYCEMMVRNGKLEHILVVPHFFEAVLQICSKKGLILTAMSHICSLCAYIENKRVPFLRFSVFLPQIGFFVQNMAQKGEKLRYITSYLDLPLLKFREFPFFTYFFGLTLFKINSDPNKNSFSQQTTKRILIISINYANYFQQGVFRNYKNMLTKICHQINKNKNKNNKDRISFHRKHGSLKVLIQLCDKQMVKKSKKQIENIRVNLKNKLLILEKNRKRNIQVSTQERQ